eukprot:12276576-Alexandrium_andersonii.AAC.1
MSASLVGSEMCIRDSIWLRPVLLVGEVNYSRDVCRKFQARLCPYDNCRSVSYTHLTLPTICSV